MRCNILRVIVLLFIIVSCQPNYQEPDVTLDRVREVEISPPDSSSGTVTTQSNPSDTSLHQKIQDSSGKFHLIYGSFKKYTRAKKLRRKLQDSGYNPEIHSAKNGYYRVAIKSFERWRNATSCLQEYYKRGDTTVWIVYR